MGYKLSILIPVYNEESTIKRLLDKVLSVRLTGDGRKEIIIVNDGSVDRSREIIEEYKANHQDEHIILHHQTRNMGKGAAIRKGISLSSGDFVIIQDADLEYDPQEYSILLKPMLDGFADVVYGSRFAGGNPHRILFFWHSIGNKLLTALSNLLTNLNLTDMESCYKLFRRDLLIHMELKERRFGFEAEVTSKIARIKGARIYEVGISYYGRTYDEGKKITWKDGLRALYVLIKCNLFR